MPIRGAARPGFGFIDGFRMMLSGLYEPTTFSALKSDLPHSQMQSFDGPSMRAILTIRRSRAAAYVAHLAAARVALRS